jgi:putative ABC transport system permease protein
LTLLAGAGLLVNSFRHLRSINPGFVPERVLTAEVSLPSAKYRENLQRIAFFQNLLERLRGLPGVQFAGATLSLPLGGGGRYWMDLEVEGRPKAAMGESVPFVSFSQITAGYLKAMRIPLTAGRAFGEHDNANSQRVALVSQSLVRHFFSNDDPIGKTIRINSTSYAVVGVVGDAVINNVKDAGLDAVYVLHPQATDGASGDMLLAIRTVSDPLMLAAALRDAVRSLDKDQSIADVRTLEQTIDTSLGQPRLNTWLFATFAALALVLALIGIYGVTSYSVAQRIQEIGIRMALGAGRGDVLGLVVTHGIRLTATGVVLGLIGAVAVTRFLKSLLYGVQPIDWATFLIASAVLAATALLASYIPARRAARVDPMVALRYE